MRSARMLLAAATVTAALAITAPAAYAADWDHDSNSYSKEHDKESKHDKPHGGMHTGGGALAVAPADDWGSAKDPKHDPDTYRGKDGGDSWGGDRGSWSGKHERPHGGMHTGGGALATPGVTAGGMAALAVAGTGLYALRRKKVSESAA